MYSLVHYDMVSPVPTYHDHYFSYLESNIFMEELKAKRKEFKNQRIFVSKPL